MHDRAHAATAQDIIGTREPASCGKMTQTAIAGSVRRTVPPECRDADGERVRRLADREHVEWGDTTDVRRFLRSAPASREIR